MIGPGFCAVRTHHILSRQCDGGHIVHRPLLLTVDTGGGSVYTVNQAKGKTMFCPPIPDELKPFFETPVYEFESMPKYYNPGKAVVEDVETLNGATIFTIKFLGAGLYGKCVVRHRGEEHDACIVFTEILSRTRFVKTSEFSAGRTPGNAIAQVIVQHRYGRLMASRFEKAVNDALA
jgi:hypothetical protein